MKLEKHRDIYYPALILLISLLLSSRNLSADGYVSVLNEDTYAFTSWAWQFTESVKDGIIYPRWMSLDFWGYGSPTFILYPPLAYYATALFESIGSSVLDAMNFLKFLSVFMTGIGIYLLTKKQFESLIASSTAVLFICSPFYVFFVYYYGTFAAICATALLPLILNEIFNFYYSDRRIHIAIGGILYGLLLMTHLITAYMFGFVILALFLTKYNRLNTLYLIKNMVFFAGFSVLVALPYLLPLIFEIDNLQINNFIDQRHNFVDFFIFPFNNSSFSPFWNTYKLFFQSNLVLYSILFMVYILLNFYLNAINTNTNRKSNIALITATAFSILVQISWSQSIWSFFPFFKFIQFPFRWTIITCLLVSLLSANILKYIRFVLQKNLYFQIFLGIIFIFIIFMDYKLINYSHIFQKSSLIQVKSVYWAKEHLPKGVDIDDIKNTNDAPEFLSALRGNFKYKTIEWKPQKKIFIIDSIGSSIIRIRHFYFTGWKAYVNGKEVLLEKEKSTGAMVVTIPEGRNQLKITFEDTLIMKISKYIFLVFILFISGLYLKLICFWA